MAATSKYSPTTQKIICDALATGAVRKDAAEAAGISFETMRVWMKSKPAFSAAVKKAEASGRISLVDIIRQASSRSWQAAAWLLERTAPESYGRNSEASDNEVVVTIKYE